MADSDKFPRREVPDASHKSRRVAALVGCRQAEAEEIGLLLDLLTWEIVNLERPAQLVDSGVVLAFVDADCLDFGIADASTLNHLDTAVIGILCDSANAKEIRNVLTLDSHLLVRPINLEAVERIIWLAS